MMSERSTRKNRIPNPLWIKLRFYVLIFLSTAVILFILFRINGDYILENTIPALLSMTNAVIAYVVSKRKQGDRTYKKMMKNIYAWTLLRFLVMLAVILILLLTKTAEPVHFIFSFIGFYIFHQLLEIGILQLETK